MCGKSRQKLAIKLAIVSHTQRLAGLPFLIHRHEDGKLLVSVTSNKLFHIAAAPPCAWGFARILRKTSLQRFHSIIIGNHPGRRFRVNFAFTEAGRSIHLSELPTTQPSGPKHGLSEASNAMLTMSRKG
jgi:hypothetical protein